MDKAFNATAEGQKAMFWESHNHVAKQTRVKALDLARAQRFDAVKAWREAGANDEEFESFTADADKAIATAESNL